MPRVKALAVFASVLGEIAAIAAMFLPLKAAFITVDGKIPSFVPDSIQALGVVTTATLMLSTAGLALGFCALMGFLRQRLLDGTIMVTARAGRVLGDQTPTHAERWVSNHSATVLVFAFLAAALLLSPWQTLFIFIGVGGLAVWSTQPWVSVNDGRPGKEESCERFGVGAKLASGWIAIGAAVVASFIDVPTLGVTGLLLAVIMGRKSIQLLGKILSSAPYGAKKVGRFGPMVSGFRGKKFEEAVTQSLSSPLSLFGFEAPLGVQTLSAPTRHTLTLSAWTESRGAIVRAYPNYAREKFNSEYWLHRTLVRDFNPTGLVLKRINSPRFLAVRFEWEALGGQFPVQDIDDAESVDWSRRFENWASGNQQVGSMNSTHDEINRAAGVLRDFQRTASLPGRHQEPMGIILARWPSVQKVLTSGPETLVFQGRGVSARLTRVPHHGVILLDGGGWTADRLGTNWGYEGTAQITMGQLKKAHNFGEADLRDALFRCALFEAYKCSRAGQFQQLAEICTDLVNNHLPRI